MYECNISKLKIVNDENLLNMQKTTLLLMQYHYHKSYTIILQFYYNNNNYILSFIVYNELSMMTSLK